MKLLIDQHLSPKLIARLADLFSESAHVQDYGLDCATDDKVWEFAGINEYTIATKDEDFNLLSVLRGNKPKVLWLVVGNCTTSQIERVIRYNHDRIRAFEQDPDVGTLILGPIPVE